MKKTIVIDAMGCLHAWYGDYAIVWKSKYLPLAVDTINRKESDLYIQNDGDVLDFISNLSENEQDMLNLGYTVISECDILDDYFIQD